MSDIFNFTSKTAEPALTPAEEPPKDRPKHEPRKRPRQKTDDTSEKTSEIEESVKQLVQRITNLEKHKPLSPAELYTAIVKKYQIPISITNNDLSKLKSTISPDEFQFLVRYRRNRSDFDLFFNLINS